MSVSPEDLDYYQRRAEAQLELAQKADLPAAVTAHVAIAERYLDYCEPLRRAEAMKRRGRPRLRPHGVGARGSNS